MDVRFLGYAPDADPTQAGVFTDCSAVVPTLRGFKGAPAARSAGLDALAAACQGAAVVAKLDNTHRIFAGSGTKLYENVSGTTWTDRTRVSGGDYALGSNIRWRFAQFGDVTLAAAKTEILQSSTTGAFANVGALIPKFGVIETVGQFVVGADANDQGNLEDNTDSPDRLWFSAKGDYTDWTPNIDTECYTLRLTSSPGKILGLRKFGSQLVVYKARSMYTAVYQGGAEVWGVEEVPGRIGATSQEAIVDVGTPENPRHIFMGFEDFYSFDGTRPVPLGINKLKVTVFGELNKARAEQCIAMHDRTNSLIYFFYPVADSVNPDKCVVYNYRSDTWGRDDRTIEAAIEYVQAGLTYDDLGNVYSTYADLPVISYNSAFLRDDYPNPAVFNTSHLLQTIDGVAGATSITTGDYGDDVNFTLMSRVKFRFLTAPSSGSLIHSYRDNIGDALTVGSTVTMGSARFDPLQEARWHRFTVEFSGDWEAPGAVLDLEKQGSE